jgi:hypothetical protein
MDNVIEALGRGKKKQGRGLKEEFEKVKKFVNEKDLKEKFEKVKNFAKKHKGKIAGVAGALGTIGSIAALAALTSKKQPRRSVGRLNLEQYAPFGLKDPQLYPPRGHEQAIPLEPLYNPFLEAAQGRRAPHYSYESEQKQGRERRSSLLSSEDIRRLSRPIVSRPIESKSEGKDGRGVKEVKDFIKKHKEKIAGIAGALGTIGSIAALAAMHKPKERRNIMLYQPPYYPPRGLEPIQMEEVPQAISLTPEHRAFLRDQSEQKQPRVRYNYEIEEKQHRSRRPSMPPLEDIPRPIQGPKTKMDTLLQRINANPELRSRMQTEKPRLYQEYVRRIPQAVPIKPIIRGPPPTGSPPIFPRRLPSPPEKKGNGKKKKQNNSLLKKVMNYKVNNNVSLKEAWKAVRGY